MEIPKSLGKISEDCFWGNEITSLTIPENIHRIDSGAFSENPISELDFEGKLLRIGKEAFPKTKEVEKALFEYATKE